MMLTGASGSSSGSAPAVRFTGGRPISARVALTPSRVWPPRTIAAMRRKACLYQPGVCSPPRCSPSQSTAVQAFRQRLASPKGRMYAGRPRLAKKLLSWSR